MTPFDTLPFEQAMLAGVAACVAAPLAGAGLAAAGIGRRSPRTLAVVSTAVALVVSFAMAAVWTRADHAAVAWGDSVVGGRLVFVDGLTVVLLPYVAAIALATLLVAPRRSLDLPLVARTLLGLAATFAIFCTSHPPALVVLWILTAIPTWRSTRAHPGGRPAARVYAWYLGIATVCIAVGTMLLLADPPWVKSSGISGSVGGWLVAIAVMIRKGIVPFHSWYPSLYTGAPMSTALAATMPQVASYTAIRLLLGHVDHAEGVAVELEVLSGFAVVTAVYGAALALAQKDLRGFIGAFAMSQSALVLAGLSGMVTLELNGAICLWVSSGLAITGIGLVTWALESRAGSIGLDTLQGRFWDAPALAGFFLLFGMAGIGLPGTLSFVADDLMVAGSLDDHLVAGLLVIASTVLSGIGVMRCWLTVFGGPTGADNPRHAILTRERVALSGLLALLFGLGIWPGPLVQSLDRAAHQLLHRAEAHAPTSGETPSTTPSVPSPDSSPLPSPKP